MIGPAMKKLTEKQRIFVMEYAADMNRSRAIKEAGYQGTKASLHAMAGKLLATPKIKAALAEVGTKLDEAGITVERLAHQLELMLFRDIADFMDSDGYLKGSLSDIPYELRQCIENIEVERRYDSKGNLVGEMIKPKLVSKAKALELAMKWKNMLQPTQINTQVNIGFDWNKFYDSPPNVVEQRFNAALEKKE